jgi:hypothetical protein
MRMLVESMYELALMERNEQLRDAERRQLLREYQDYRSASRAAGWFAIMDALAIIRSAPSLRGLPRLLRPT